MSSISSSSSISLKELILALSLPAAAVLAIGMSSLTKKHSTTERYGCIELGGTSIRLAIGLRNSQKNTCEIIDSTLESIMTTDPMKNILQIEEYFTRHSPIDRVGIASFGPVCLDEFAENYGSITTTPKPAWQHFPILKRVAQVTQHRKHQRIGIDTDVNAAALAEFQFGGHETKKSLAYITVGTGVGVGLIIDGKCVHGLTHPEGGHIIVKPYPGETFQGACKFHGGCIEGLVSNFAIAAQVGRTAEELASLSNDEVVWDKVAYYLAQLCLNLTLLASPEVIVIGGGIMNRSKIISKIRDQFKKLLNDYVQHPALADRIDTYIVKPKFVDSGLLGSMVV